MNIFLFVYTIINVRHQLCVYLQLLQLHVDAKMICLGKNNFDEYGHFNYCYYIHSIYTF